MVTGRPEKLVPCNVGAVSPTDGVVASLDTNIGQRHALTRSPLPVSWSAAVSCFLLPPPSTMMVTAINGGDDEHGDQDGPHGKAFGRGIAHLGDCSLRRDGRRSRMVSTSGTADSAIVRMEMWCNRKKHVMLHGLVGSHEVLFSQTREPLDQVVVSWDR